MSRERKLKDKLKDAKEIQRDIQKYQLKGSGWVDFEWKGSGIYSPLLWVKNDSVASSAEIRP